MTRARTALFVAILAGLLAAIPLLLRSDPGGKARSGGLQAATSGSEETGKAATLSGVDFTGLTPAQVSLAMQVLNENRCNCGCGMTLAECRTKDPKCGRSLTAARGVVQDLKNGKSKATVQSNLAATLARMATPPPAAAAPPPRPAEDPNKIYKIDTAGSPFKGPSRARVVLVEFSDYQ